MPGGRIVSLKSRPPRSMKVLLRGVKDAHVFVYRIDVQKCDGHLSSRYVRAVQRG